MATKPDNLSNLSTPLDVKTINITNSINNSVNSFFMASKSVSSSYQTLQIQSSSTSKSSVGSTETAITSNPHVSPSIHTMTIPTQNFPPSHTQTQSIFTTTNKSSNNNESMETINNISTNFTKHTNLCFKNTTNSETSLVDSSITSFNRSFSNNKSLLASTNSITKQRSSATASLLFVRPANYARTLYVGKLPFLLFKPHQYSKNNNNKINFYIQINMRNNYITTKYSSNSINEPDVNFFRHLLNTSIQ